MQKCLNAKMFKCKNDGKVTYQAKPCKSGGNEFIVKGDIGKKKQKEGTARYNKLLIDVKERQQQYAIAADKERLIRAQEDKAAAAERAAYESSEQTEAMHYRNYLESRKRLY